MSKELDPFIEPFIHYIPKNDWVVYACVSNFFLGFSANYIYHSGGNNGLRRVNSLLYCIRTVYTVRSYDAYGTYDI